MTEPITWHDLQARLGALVDDTTAYITGIEERVLESTGPGAKRRGFVEMRDAMRDVLADLEKLHAEVMAAPPPVEADPVLAATGEEIDRLGSAAYDLLTPMQQEALLDAEERRREAAASEQGGEEALRRGIEEAAQEETRREAVREAHEGG